MVSTIRNSQLSPTITVANLGDAIKSAFTAMGYTSSNVIDDYILSGNRTIVYEKIFDVNKIFGRIQWRIQISSSLSVTQVLQTGWNTGTKAITNGGTSSSSVTFSASAGIAIKSFQSDIAEHDLVILSQGSLQSFLGWIKPASLNQIDENAYPAALQFTAVNSRGLLSAGLTPYGTSGTNIAFSFADISITSTNHYNQRDSVQNVPIVSQAGKGIYGTLSNDWLLSAGTGLALFEQAGNWSLINPITASSSVFLK
jgi:hypothetical protein